MHATPVSVSFVSYAVENLCPMRLLCHTLLACIFLHVSSGSGYDLPIKLSEDDQVEQFLQIEPEGQLEDGLVDKFAKIELGRQLEEDDMTEQFLELKPEKDTRDTIQRYQRVLERRYERLNKANSPLRRQVNRIDKKIAIKEELRLINEKSARLAQQASSQCVIESKEYHNFMIMLASHNLQYRAHDEAITTLTAKKNRIIKEHEFKYRSLNKKITKLEEKLDLLLSR